MLNKSKPKQSGYTLVEISMSMAILIILAGFSITVYRTSMFKHDLDITTSTYVQSLRQAQIRSRAVKDDSSWSVHIQPESITLFKGSDYSTRDQNFDEVSDFPPNIIPSGLQTITFEKLYGTTSNPGTTILTSSTNEERNIEINQMGLISSE